MTYLKSHGHANSLLRITHNLYCWTQGILRSCVSAMVSIFKESSWYCVKIVKVNDISGKKNILHSTIVFYLFQFSVEVFF